LCVFFKRAAFTLLLWQATVQPFPTHPRQTPLWSVDNDSSTLNSPAIETLAALLCKLTAKRPTALKTPKN
jgi:hypothetical protein